MRCARQLRFVLAGCAVALLGWSCQTRPETRDDALVILSSADADEIDPRLVSDAYGLKISRLVFASLITIDPHTLDVTPDLAERVDQESSTVYVVHLRPNLHFSDGTTLDAQDVVATYRSIVAPDIGSRYSRSYRNISRIDVLDPLTVRFTLQTPRAPFITDLELPILRAEDEHQHITWQSAVGAGPYRIASRSLGHIELTANPRWYRGRPRTARARFIVVRDNNTRALRLLAGAGDIALNALPPMLLPMFEHTGDFKIRSASGISTTYLGFNLDAPALHDVRVRRAIAYAIDRPALIRAKFGGYAELARGWVPTSHWSYEPNVPTYDYDPARARALLRDAGFGSGARALHLVLRTSTDGFRQSIARAMAAMLGDVGIDVDVRPSEVPTLLADLNSGRFELTTLQLPDFFEPDVLSWFFASDKIPAPGHSDGANRWRYRNPELDALFASGRTTSTRPERYRIYSRAQQILATDLPVVPLWHESVVAVTTRRARTFEIPHDGRFSTLAR